MKFIPVAEPTIGEKEIEYVSQAVKSGWVSSMGPFIDRFEKDFARYCGTKHAVAVSNGTTGLHLALISAGIKPGDEVIVPDLTFVATANSVVHAGATPIFADIDPETLSLDPRSFAAAITPKTRAVVPVHLYGHPADMDKIQEIADEHKLLLIEDAAESVGSEYKGKRVGAFGNCAMFSFYGNKIITSGEGGMITTDDDALNEKARRLRDHAMLKTRRYWHEEVGYNYRMTNLQAALGVAQLERVEEILEHRRKAFARYSGQIKTRPGVRLNPRAPWAAPVYWLTCLEVDSFTEEKRARFMADLKEMSIDSRPYFYPVSDMPMYKKAEIKTPHAHQASIKGVNLPLSFNLRDSEIDYICEKVNQLLSKGL